MMGADPCVPSPTSWSRSTLSNSLGALGSGGVTLAAFTLPPGAPVSLAGLTVHHAYATVASGGVISHVSNATPVALVP